MVNTTPRRIFTIGHSSHPIDTFISLLQRYDIQTLADVRSKPRSRWPHFSQNRLREALSQHASDYVYFGDELGGHPDVEELYDSEDHVVYERIASDRGFRRGIRRLVELAVETHLVIMCAEGKPEDCHRHPLLGRSLTERDVRVVHILRDGSTIDAQKVAESHSPQLSLFETPGEDLTWKSPKRIPRRKR